MKKELLLITLLSLGTGSVCAMEDESSPRKKNYYIAADKFQNRTNYFVYCALWGTAAAWVGWQSFKNFEASFNRPSLDNLINGSLWGLATLFTGNRAINNLNAAIFYDDYVEYQHQLETAKEAQKNTIYKLTKLED